MWFLAAQGGTRAKEHQGSTAKPTILLGIKNSEFYGQRLHAANNNADFDKANYIDIQTTHHLWLLKKVT